MSSQSDPLCYEQQWAHYTRNSYREHYNDHFHDPFERWQGRNFWQRGFTVEIDGPSGSGKVSVVWLASVFDKQQQQHHVYSPQ